MNAVVWPLLAMMLVQAMTMLAVVTVPVLAPALSADLGVPADRVGVYQSCVFAGAAVLTLLSGSLVRRCGGIRVNQISVAIGTAGLLSISGGTIAVVLGGGVLVGAAYGLATPGASHVLARVAPPRHRGLVFSLKQAAVPAGGLIAGLLVPPIVEASGWQTAVLTVACIVATAALAVQPLRARIDEDRDPGHAVRADAVWRAVRMVVTTGGLRAIAVVAFGYGAMQLSLFAFLVTYLVERAGLGLVEAGGVFAAMQATGIGARVLWGWVSDRRLGPRSLLALLGVGIIASTAAAAAIGDGWPLPAIVLVAAALGATAVGWNGVYLAETARLVPLEDVGTATGGILMFTFVGVVLGPACFGGVVASTGSYAAALAALNLPVLAAVLMLSRPGRAQRGADL